MFWFNDELYMDTETKNLFVVFSRLSRILAYKQENPYRVSNYKKLMLYLAKYKDYRLLIEDIKHNNVLPQKNIEKILFF